jgi:hypothetical protein
VSLAVNCDFSMVKGWKIGEGLVNNCIEFINVLVRKATSPLELQAEIS